MRKIRAAVIQTVSGTDPAANTAAMRRLVRQAVEQGADWALLPEYWPLMGQNDCDKLALAEPFGSGTLQQAMAETAAECGVTLFGGTISLQSPVPGKVWNSLLAYDKNGECIGRYDKMHLFGYSDLGERYAEADTIAAGREVPHLTADGWNLAQGICYDLRFPELFRAQAPADLIMLPAAFTYATGKAHWELLLRARAVENQCYVVAAAQTGTHENGRRTFGHSMIIDPWGDIIAMQPENEGIALATIDKARIEAIRASLPALQHRVL